MINQENGTHFSVQNACDRVRHFRWNTEFPVACAVHLPADRVGELAEFLASLGVPFDPKLDVFAAGHNPLHPTNFTGEDIPMLVEEINAHLSGRNLHPLIPNDHEKWSVSMRHALLTMAAQNFSWVGKKMEPSYWEEILLDGWPNIVREYAIVFNGELR